MNNREQGGYKMTGQVILVYRDKNKLKPNIKWEIKNVGYKSTLQDAIIIEEGYTLTWNQALKTIKEKMNPDN